MATLSGSVYQDLDADGGQDSGEPNLPGWIVYRDDNRNGFLEPRETWAATDEQGQFAFRNLPAGSYQVRRATDVGVVRAGTLDPSQSATLAADQVLAELDFGVVLGTAPAATRVTAPQGTLFDLTPRVEWLAVPGCGYDVQLDDLTSGTRQTAFVADGAHWLPPAPLLSNHTYAVRVRAVDQRGVVGPWSDPQSFAERLLPPVELNPPRFNGLNYDFSWSAAPAADYYDVWVYDLATGAGVARNTQVRGTSVWFSTALVPGRTYGWAVRSLAAAGASSVWSSRGEFRLPAAYAPNAIAPLASGQGLQPEFRWDAVPLAEAYDVQVVDGATGKLVLRAAAVTTTWWTPPSPLAPGKYRWYLRGYRSDGRSSPWSPAVEYTAAEPSAPAPLQAIRPRAVVNALDVRLQWESPNPGTVYNVWIFDPLTSSGVTSQSRVAGNSWTLPVRLDAAKPYRWKIQAVTPEGMAGPWIDGPGFAVRQAYVPDPIGVSSDSSRPIFQWQSVSSAGAYDIWVYDPQTGQGVMRNSQAAGSIWYASTPLEPGREYAWMVRAIGVGGELGVWSRRQKFTVQNRSAVIPGNVDSPNGLGLVLRWEPAAWAASYEVVVQDASGREIAAVRGLSTLDWLPDQRLTSDTSIRWRVRGVAGDGSPGPWSPFQSLVVGQTNVTTGLRPVLDGVHLRVEWNPVAGATAYDVWIFDPITRRGLALGRDVPGTSWQIPVGLTAGTGYGWMVRAVDARGAAGAWSPSGTFSLPSDTVPRPGFALRTEAAWVFEWTPSAGAASYDIWVYERSSGRGVASAQGVPDARWTLSPTLPPGNYAWMVRPVAADGSRGPWSHRRGLDVLPSSPVANAVITDAERTLWNNTLQAYLQDPLWQARDAYDATHSLIVPLHAAFRANETAWQAEFAAFFQRFVQAAGEITPSPLDRLQFYYLASQFIKLATRAGREELIPDGLRSIIEQELQVVWYGPRAIWDEAFPGGTRERLAWIMASEGTGASYRRAVTDSELFTLAIAADLVATARLNGRPEASPLLTEIVSTAKALWQAEGRFLPDGGWLFQPGVWTEHPDYRYAGRSLPVAGMSESLVPGIGTDTSHALRFPLWLRSLQEAFPEGSEGERFFAGVRSALGIQLHQRVLRMPGSDLPFPALTNYLDGTNGLFRWNYVTFEPNHGMLPYGASGSLLVGWWSLLDTGREQAIFAALLPAFSAADALIGFHGLPLSTRPVHPLLTQAAPYQNGLFELLVRLSAKLAAETRLPG